MAKVKNKESAVEEVAVEQQAEPKVLTHTALGVYQDPITGKWYVTKVRYNPLTKEVGEYQVVDADETSKDATLYRFKIAAATEVFN